MEATRPVVKRREEDARRVKLAASQPKGSEEADGAFGGESSL